jgi:non-ribosomal peptide synthetase component F
VLRLGGEQRRALAAACRRFAATPFVVLLTALVHELEAWSPDGGVVVTTDHANRDGPGFDRLVGLLADVLPIAVAAGGAGDPVALLPRVQLATREALSRRVLPFADLVDAIAPGMLPGYDLLFPVGFFLESAAPERGARPGRLRSRAVGNDAVSRPLMVTAELAADSLSVCFERRGGWLSDPLLDELARGFGSALGALLEGPT